MNRPMLIEPEFSLNEKTEQLIAQFAKRAGRQWRRQVRDASTSTTELANDLHVCVQALKSLGEPWLNTYTPVDLASVNTKLEAPFIDIAKSIELSLKACTALIHADLHLATILLRSIHSHRAMLFRWMTEHEIEIDLQALDARIEETDAVINQLHGIKK